MARYNFDKDGKIIGFSKSSRELAKEKAATIIFAVIIVITAPIIIPLILISTWIYNVLLPHAHLVFVLLAIIATNVAIATLFGTFVWHLPRSASITLGVLIYGSFSFVFLLYVADLDIIWSSFGGCLLGAVGGALFSMFHAALKPSGTPINRDRKFDARPRA